MLLLSYQILNKVWFGQMLEMHLNIWRCLTYFPFIVLTNVSGGRKYLQTIQNILEMGIWRNLRSTESWMGPSRTIGIILLYYFPVQGKVHLHSCIAGKKDNWRRSVLRKDNPKTMTKIWVYCKHFKDCKVIRKASKKTRKVS